MVHGNVGKFLAKEKLCLLERVIIKCGVISPLLEGTWGGQISSLYNHRCSQQQDRLYPVYLSELAYIWSSNILHWPKTFSLKPKNNMD